MQQPQSTSDEFASPPQQVASTEVFPAQPSAQEHDIQTQDGHSVAQRRRGTREGSRQKPLEYARDGELYVGSFIRKLRWEKGWQLKETAEKMGFTRSNLSSIETNRSMPSEENLKKIAKVLGVSVDELQQAYQHPRTIHRTPPEKSKRFLELQRPLHHPGAPVTEFEKEFYYRPNSKVKPDRFRQER